MSKPIHFDVLGMTCAPELRDGIDELIEYAVGYLIASGHLRAVDAVGAKQVLRCKLLQGPPPTAC